VTGRWRWRVTRLKGPDQVGDWQLSIERAREDAVRSGVAKHDPEEGYFFDVLTTLEEEK
jgi:hypothetical protein